MSRDFDNRRMIRLKGYDYSQPGKYFVTVCTAERLPIFGTIVDGAMIANDVGDMVEIAWREIPKYCQNIEIDLYPINACPKSSLRSPQQYSC